MASNPSTLAATASESKVVVDPPIDKVGEADLPGEKVEEPAGEEEVFALMVVVARRQSKATNRVIEKL